MGIGDRIANLRKSNGWTQNELAKMISCSNKAVSKWENGLGTPSIDYLQSLARVFHITIDELVTGKNPLLDANKDPLYLNIVNYLVSDENTSKTCSIAAIQKKFKLGFCHASRIVDQLEENGIIADLTDGDSIHKRIIVSKEQIQRWLDSF